MTWAYGMVTNGEEYGRGERVYVSNKWRGSISSVAYMYNVAS